MDSEDKHDMDGEEKDGNLLEDAYMIMCDNCEEWCHFKCINQLPSKEQEWFCSDCVH